MAMREDIHHVPEQELMSKVAPRRAMLRLFNDHPMLMMEFIQRHRALYQEYLAQERDELRRTRLKSAETRRARKAKAEAVSA